MQSLKLCLILLTVVGINAAACGTHDTSSDTTGDGGGGDGTSVVTHCGIYTVDEVCDPCLHRECCAELAACGAAGNHCISCVGSGVGDHPQCIATKDLALAVSWCLYNRCKDTCWGDHYSESSGSGSSSSGSGG